MSALRLAALPFLRALGLCGSDGRLLPSASAPAPFPPRLPLLDARSPLEFNQGHIPGASNRPLFSDQERAAVGTIFRKHGQERAVREGLSLVGPRMASLADDLVETAGPGRELALYCSRGGMRSASLAWLCGLLGIRTYVLEGGYKAFRRYVLESFDRPRTLMVLGGKTGSGKTEVLRSAVALGAQVIDLEGLARHRGSAFGAMAESQPSCEHFENLLSVALGQYAEDAGIWVEDESENIGKVNVPKALFQQLRAAPVVVLEVPPEVRLARVVAEYGDIPKERMAECLDRIKKRLGGLEHKRGHTLLENDDLMGLAGILLDYYDKAYARQLCDRHIAGTLKTSSVAAAAASLAHWTDTRRG